MCDTFIALGSRTASGAIIFGKNSDREPNEEQCLEYIPAQDHRSDDTLQCTYLTIPQVAHTHAILISRPFWMWGAEMGANEYGVVIGNEAVFTKVPGARDKRLTGMDLLRLALERAVSSREALTVMTELLDAHGQGGPCGYQDKKMAYHNSFILADPEEAWVLETAGPFWAAKQVRDATAISNGLTLGSDLDLMHPGLIDHAKEKGWLKPGETFHFARCYSDWFYTTFSGCRARRARSLDLLNDPSRSLDLLSAFAHLRDHGKEPYRPDRHFLMTRVCAHAANPLSRHAAQTTASFVAELHPANRTYWVTATAAPCISWYKPVRFHENWVLDLEAAMPSGPDGLSTWWNHERLHRTVLLDFPHRHSLIESQRDQWEQGMVEKATATSDRDFHLLSRKAFEEARQMEADWLERFREQPVTGRNRWLYSLYWARQNRASGVRL